MNNEHLLLSGALRVFRDFSTSNVSSPAFVYGTDNENFGVLTGKYPVLQAAGDGSDLSKALNLLRWVHDNAWHNGGTKDVEFVRKDSVSILDYCYGKGAEFGVYCRLQAIVFTECCLAVGLKARMIHCLPFSPYDYDSHVVSMVFIPSLKKWIMLDPGSNAWFIGSNGEILSPWEARVSLGQALDIRCNTDLFPRSTQSMDEKTEDYIQYMTKNLFYIKCSRINTFGTDLAMGQKTYYLAPAGFDIAGRELAYCQFAVDNSPPHLLDDWKRGLEQQMSTMNIERLVISLEQFISQ